ncbi:Protein CBR-GLB-4 [Caenorhabditis briggsae]|uniref:Protein CBR-GLB-4 n=1 Tax=Caenorhabditis briggsae TaxID=6238 RepID=A8WT37_CAEBR|nr:Protein CBR-GLB-4 [Caenorhabditis briggsae]CAP23648.1 Protein CBR-GLB-4 [Caenorhabditis briggsae]
MGNQSARQLSTHRKHVVHTEAWLKSAELTPTWVWALVDLPETMHSRYKENAQFLNIINQVRDFLNILIKVHKCDPEMIKTLSFRLGARHRHYMNEGNDNCYWAPFAQQLPIAMSKMYMRVVNEDSKIRRILRIRSRAAEKSEEEEVCESWRQFSCMLIESMKRGYEGCASEKTPLRLSITNSIISMASMRSTRSRSASHFLEPNMSPAIVYLFSSPIHQLIQLSTNRLVCCVNSVVFLTFRYTHFLFYPLQLPCVLFWVQQRVTQQLQQLSHHLPSLRTDGEVCSKQEAIFKGTAKISLLSEIDECLLRITHQFCSTIATFNFSS